MRTMKVSLVLLSIVAALLLNLIFNPSVAARSTENNEECTSAAKLFENFEKSSKSGSSNQNGSICDGKCCNGHEETLLYEKAGEKLKKIMKTQLNSLRDLWRTSFITYKDRLSDLVNHSENRTLHLFLTVYQRMFPLTKQPITELYESIRSHINTKPSEEYGLEPAIEVFFKNLFPIAYHHAVESHDIKFMEELSVDYKSCLKKNFESLKPFGDIPQITSRILTQYIGSSNIFLRALDDAGRIVNDMEKFATNNISPNCQKALLKMDYCAQCKGFSESKPCRSYCSNVLSGCLTFFSNGFENNWSAFVETMEHLVASRNKETFDKSIKTLDGKLSEAIMYAMTNGPELEKKVNSACGNHGTKSNRKKPSSLPGGSIETITLGSPKLQPNNLKWASPPPDTAILELLSNLDRFKKFSLQMTNEYCDDDYKIDDVQCWNSENIGKYLQPIVDIYSQKYNPEIPELQNLNDNKVFNELNDRLLSSRSSINKQIASLKYESDKMFSDMAPMLDDGSAEYDDDLEDERDDDELSGSGDDMGRGDIPITPGVDVTIPNRKTTTSTSCALKETSWHVSILMMIFTLSCFNQFRYLEVCD